jgi:hypothetical protein
MDYLVNYGNQTVSQSPNPLNEHHIMIDSSQTVVDLFRPTNIEQDALDMWKHESLQLALQNLFIVR